MNVLLRHGALFCHTRCFHRALQTCVRAVFGQWRNTLAVMTALAIIGFSLFPLMPPRLLDAPCPDEGFGAAVHRKRICEHFNDAENFGFVDTIRRIWRTVGV